MGRIKTSELTGAALDWAVAKCEGKLNECTQARNFYELCKQRGGVAFTHGKVYSPSTDWSQAGPIIERERIATMFHPEWEVPNWGAWRTDGDDHQEVMGETPLIAAMRCYVASKLGNEVDVPEELSWAA